MTSGIRRVIWSAILAIPAALAATWISDSTVFSNGFRYAFSPGTMLALRFVKVETSHRGLGVFLDALNWYGRVMSCALVFNVFFYSLLIFGIVTAIAGAKAEKG